MQVFQLNLPNLQLFMCLHEVERFLLLEQALEEGFVLPEGRTGLFGTVLRETHGLRVIFDFLTGVEDLLHLIEQLVVLVLHLAPGGRIDAHGLVAIYEVIDLEAVGLVDLGPIVGYHITYAEEETKELYYNGITVLISLVDPKPLYDSCMESGI